MQTDPIAWLLAGFGLLCLIAAIVLRGGRSAPEPVAPQLAELATTLRAELSKGQADAFDRVMAGNVAMQAVVGAFRSEITDRLGASATDTRGALETFGRAQAGQLEAMGKLLREADARSQIGLTALGETVANRLRAEGEALRTQVGLSLTEMRAGNEQKLNEMRAAVDEKLQAALEKQVGESFQRVAEQFAAVQQAIGQVQSVASQVGDLKRLFSNVASRGGWGEAQVETMLDEHLQPGGYERRKKLREGSGEMVDFAIRIPSRGDTEMWLPVDSKFPTEAYDRLLTAAETGDRDAEKQARADLERAIRKEAASIFSKYVVPPLTSDFAVLYVPSDSLFAEIARIPGLIQALRNEAKIIVMGPSLLPAFLHAVRVGHLTLSLERRASEIGQTLGAVRAEWKKLSDALDKLGEKAVAVSDGFSGLRTRTKAVGRRLQTVTEIEAEQSDAILGLDPPTLALSDETVT